MMLRMRRETVSTEQQITPQIDNILVLDRMVDPLTPLLSQLTYEGLIDELFGIRDSEYIICWNLMRWRFVMCIDDSLC